MSDEVNVDTNPGWHSRGYLPHFDRAATVQSVTFRLADSLPKLVIDRWKVELGCVASPKATSESSFLLRRRVAQYEDMSYGSCALRLDRNAECVQAAMLHFDQVRYRLLAWSVMPNHVHAVLETGDEWSLGKVVNSWKRHSARQINAWMGTTGEAFWAPDYFDRFIRDAVHLSAAINYVHQNPVKAGLCHAAESWRWSSAYREAK